MLALEKGRPGECYQLVDECLRLADLAARAAAASGRKDRTIVFPDWMLKLNAGVMSIVERIVPVPDILGSDALRGMLAGLTLTVETHKACAELGWKPRPMADELVRRSKKLTPLLEGVAASQSSVST